MDAEATMSTEVTETANVQKIIFNEELLSSIKRGDCERIRANLEDHHPSQSIDAWARASGSTLLHYAARHGNAAVTQLLLDLGCYVDAQDSMGKTPLMIAIEEANEAAAKVLIAIGPDMSLLNHKNKSVLHVLHAMPGLRYSTYKLVLGEFRRTCDSSEEAAENLIDAGLQLYLAIFTLDFKVIECMLERGRPVDSRHPTYGYTAMHMAVYYDDLDSVRLLLKHGADAKALDRDKASPLHYLYKREKGHNFRKVEILRTLLSLGVSPTACASEGRFVARYTLIRGDREAICTILQSNLDFKARDVLYGRTVLHYLVQNFDPSVVEELAFHTGNTWYDVNAADRLGMTPLYWAVMCANVEMTKYLLSKGAQPNLQLHECPVLFYAYFRTTDRLKEKGDRLVEILLENDADPQFVVKERDGWELTVFDFALAKNGYETIKPVVAQLSLMEKSGVTITKRTRDRIASDDKLDELFKECQGLVGEEIFESTTFHKLMNIRQWKIERYLKNEGFVGNMKTFNRKHKLKSAHPYLYNKWRRRYDEGKERNKLKEEAVGGICKVFRGRIDRNHLVTENVTEYLDVQSLRQLVRL